MRRFAAFGLLVVAGTLVAEVPSHALRVIRFLGEAAGRGTGEKEVGGAAGVGFEVFDDGKYYFRLRANSGLSSFTVKNGSKSEYGAILLQPDTRGASFSIDGAKVFKTYNDDIHIGLGLSFRASPLMTWSFDIPATQAGAAPTSNDAPATALALGVGGTLLWRISDKDPSVAVGADVLFSVRSLAGDVTKNERLLNDTLGTSTTTFPGFEIRLKGFIGDLGVFVGYAYHYASAPVLGIGGSQVVFGVEIKGSMFSKEQKPAAALEREVPPPKPAHTPRFSL